MKPSAAWVLLGIFAAGCSDDAIGLSIDVRTDLSPSNEFARVVVTLVGEGEEQERGAQGDFVSGVRVADFEALDKSESRTVRVDLLNGAGGLVVRGEVLVNHREDRGLVVVMTRDCRDVSCADASTTCRGGGCVALDCVDGTQPSCPEPECRLAADCPPADPCSEALCGEGVCLYAPVSDACMREEYCDPDRGCVPVMSMPDAGPLSDASMDVAQDAADAGTDAGPPELTAPRLTWPPNGSYTGAWNRSPRFFWEPVVGANQYSIQVDGSCETRQDVPCAFDSPEWTRGTTGTMIDPEEGIIDVLARGQRMRWRVRACMETECGPWSAQRYLEVGVAELDFDGDQLNDMVIGAGSELTRVSIEAPLVPTAQESVNVAGSIVAVERGDFNADGLSDVLAVSLGAANLVQVYMGAAGGLGAPMQVEALPGAPTRVTCSADFDADGYRDVALQSSRESYVYWGSASGLESDPLALGEAFATCGDVNLDGFADLVVGSGYYSGRTLRGTPRVESISGLQEFQFVGDVNQDGYRDAILTGTRASLVFGNGNGFDAPEELPVELGALGHIQMVGLGNVERFGVGHGRMSVWADPTYMGSGGVAYRTGAGTDFLHGPCACEALGEELRFGMDLNGDTFPDLALAHRRGVYFFFGQPGGYAMQERTYEHSRGLEGTWL